MTVEHIFESSSNLKKAQYDPTKEVLTITFHTNVDYQYFAVPQDIVDALFAQESQGESAGKYFNGNVKGQYQYQRVEEQE